MMLATRAPEMALSPEEAKTLAEAIADVERHYPAVSALLHGKIADHVALGVAVLSIYGTRLAAIGIRVKRENAEAAPKGTVTVLQRG